MNEEEIGSAMRGFVLEEFLPGVDPAELTDETPLISGGIIDSLATTRLVAFIEKTFSVRLGSHEMGADTLDTITAICALVTKKRAANVSEANDG